MKTTLAAGLAFLALPSLDAFASRRSPIPNGENRATPTVLTVATNPTSLEITSGTATQSGNITQSGGSFSIQKTGAGTLILSGTNVYSGGTTIRNGVLQVTDSITDGSNSLHVAELAGETAALTISCSRIPPSPGPSTTPAACSPSSPFPSLRHMPFASSGSSCSPSPGVIGKGFAP